MKKYSDWFRVDLHIHTDKSNETKHNDYNGNFDINLLKSKLKECNVGIFSLTDHNIINVQAYEDYINNYNSLEDPLLLLGIELDVEVDCEKPQYHTLLIFRDNSLDYVKDINDRLETLYAQKGTASKFDRFVTLDDIVSIFKKEDFFFIPHSDKDGHKNIVSAYKKDIPTLQRMVLLMHSAMEKVTDAEMKQHYFYGFKNALEDTFQRKEDIPYINFSDNHNCHAYPLYGKTDRNHSFDYIKGIRSFESIRLAFIDPSSRIKSEQDYNAIDRTMASIETLKFSDNPFVSNTVLEFSPYFNVIIGGRSSGKSLLLSLLGNRINEISLKNTDRYNAILREGECLIKSSLDATPKSRTVLSQGVLYIQQGEITDYFESENLHSLVLATDNAMIQEYDNAQRKFDEKKTNFSLIVQNMLSAYKRAEESNICSKIIIHNSDINFMLDDKNYIFKIDTLKQENDCRQKEQKINNAFEAIKSLITQIEMLNIHDDVLGWTEEEGEIISEFHDLLRKKREHLSSEISLSTKKTKFLLYCKSMIRETNQVLNSNSQQKQAAIDRKNKAIQDIAERFLILKELRDKTIETIDFDHSLLHKISLRNGITLIREFKSDGFSNKEIFMECIKTANDDESLFLNLLAVLQNRKTVKQYSSSKWPDLEKKMNNEISSFYNRRGPLKDFLQYENGETSLNSSPGLNSEKYMDILFESSLFKTCLIDQPEDNLSHTYIAEGLVNKIRKNKYSKQFIVVTHNPSIVVYGDAECIILAEKNNNVISYQQLTLEDKESQKMICATLDGGEYVFNNRSNKYNIRRVK